MDEMRENGTMATVTLSIPEQMKEFIDARVEGGDFADPEDYLRDLVRRDQERRLAELRQTVQDAITGGISRRTFEERMADGDRALEAQSRLDG